MKATRAGVWVMMLATAAGCSTRKGGVVRDLPDPVFASPHQPPPPAVEEAIPQPAHAPPDRSTVSART